MIPVPARLLLLLAALAAMAFGVILYGNGRYEDGQAATQALWNAEKLRQSQAVIKERDLQIESNQEIERVAKISQARIADDARRAGLVSVRVPARTFAAGGDEAATAAPGCQAERGRSDVLAELLGEADDYAGKLAQALDQSRAAGLACERWADEVSHSNLVSHSDNGDIKEN